MKKNLKAIWRDHKMLLVLTSSVILLQMLLGVLLWDRLPDTIATHFGMNNEPDGWSSKAFTVFGMPLMLLALHWVCLLISCSPKYMMKNAQNKIRYMTLMIVPASSLMVTVICYGYALGAPFHVGRVCWVFVGLIFAVTGNYLPKIRQNPTTGIKIPWTLSNEENWNRTHRFAGPLWVICGILLVVLGLIGGDPRIATAAILLVVLLPVAYSLAFHLKKKKQ